MEPNTLIRYRRDLFVVSRNPFAARWSTRPPQPIGQAPLANLRAAYPDGAEPADEEVDDEDVDDEDDDEFDDDAEDGGDEDDEGTGQTTQPGGSPHSPNTLTDAERPGVPTFRQGDRGGPS